MTRKDVVDMVAAGISAIGIVLIIFSVMFSLWSITTPVPVLQCSIIEGKCLSEAYIAVVLFVGAIICFIPRGILLLREIFR